MKLFTIFSILMGSISFKILAANDINSSQPFVGFYGSDPETLDYLYTYKHVDSRHFANFIDGLLEHDAYGNLVGAMATHWSSNEDASIWTFNLRQGAHWYTDEGIEYAEVTAHDFVTGLQHAADFQSQTLYLVQELIENLDDYVQGTVNFEEVGVTALDDYTLQYHLTAPAPYFPSLTTYSILLPVNQEFLESKGNGCQLGSPDFSACSFGSLSPDSILYNGAYILKNFTSKSVIEYEANPNYWDKSQVYIPSVKLIYAQQADPTTLFLAFDRGEIMAAPIDVNNPSIVAAAKKKYGDSIFVTDTNAAISFATFVFNRQQYHSPLNESVDISPKTEKQREDTKTAILNTNFRQGIQRAIDTAAINGQAVGEELKYTSLRNMLTQPSFVTTTENETYSQLVTKSLQALEPNLYPQEFTLEDGHMAYFDPELAQELMATARTQLEKEGVTFPVYLDVLVNGESEMHFRSAQALKQSIEEHLTDQVKINLIISTRHHFQAAKTAEQINTDLYFSSAWSPDYGDPKSYLDILDPDAGDLLKSFGLSRKVDETSEETSIKEHIGLKIFKCLKDKANLEVSNLDKRYAMYAEAEAYALNQAYFIPLYSSGGSYAISRIIPYTKSYSPYGLSEMKFKRMQLSSEIITATQRDQYHENWLEYRNKKH